MKAMRLHRTGTPLSLDTVETPRARAGELVLEVEACGVCRTDLHVIDGDLPAHKLPLVPGHEVVGNVVELGAGVTGISIGQRMGVPWLGHTCGVCPYCRSGRENLCDAPAFTGYDIDGGYAEYTRAEAAYCIALPEDRPPDILAPLLCAGLIGFRSYRHAGDAQTIGLYGFGAAAHLLVQVARDDEREVFAFTRPGDVAGQAFARTLGCRWAGGSDEQPPRPLDAAIIFAPVGALVPAALRTVRKGGRVVCAGIHMSDIPSFPYADLWQEREIVSVANLTREDGRDYFSRIARLDLHPHVRRFALADANDALAALRHGALQGAAVLIP